MLFLAAVVAWGSWFFRFVPDRDLVYLDRWTGSIVMAHPNIGVSERMSLVDLVVDSTSELEARLQAHQASNGKCKAKDFLDGKCE
jgi:hypothetical protein